MMKEIKKYERGYDVGEKATADKIRLTGFDLFPEKFETLLSVDEFTQERFEELFDVKTGQWCVEDGWVVGKNPDMCPGMIVSKGDFFGDVMLEITAATVLPSTHDINIMLHGEWDDEKGRGNAYVTGMEAFWHGYIGFEKSPKYDLTAATALFDFEPGREYRFSIMNLGNRIFVFVDDRMCFDIKDSTPIDAEKYGKIGVEAFSSYIKFKNLRVYKPAYEKVKEYYCPEF